jgi:hypothetical protein
MPDKSVKIYIEKGKNDNSRVIKIDGCDFDI